MRDYDEQDPKSPKPVTGPTKKGINGPEAAEALPFRLVRKDNDRDAHRHVC